MDIDLESAMKTRNGQSKLSKGPGKRGHIFVDTSLPTQMFSRFPARATFVACVRDTKNVSDFVQKHFVSATNVSQFAQPKKHHGQQCVRNNVFSFARTFKPCCRTSTVAFYIVEQVAPIE